MRWNACANWMMLCLGAAALAGCAHTQAVDPPESPTASVPSIPLAIRGQQTITRLAFPTGDQRIEPGQFNSGEICYLTVGDFRIDCYSDGSSLNLGPTDSNDLLTDNPTSGLSPVHDDKVANQTMKLYSVLFLVAGSIDRLPTVLADYIESPGPHLYDAVALAQLLLNTHKLQFQGYARGGNFTVSVELTDDGRDKLVDALEEAGEPIGAIQFATLHSVPCQ